MTHDLTTTKGRQEAIKDLNISCDADIIKTGFNAAPTMIVEVDRWRVQIGIKNTDKERTGWKMEWSSDIEITSKEQPFYNQANALHFAAPSSFNPENKAAYWRTLHAASALLNWDKICPIVDEYCSKYRQLEEDIRIQNNAS